MAASGTPRIDGNIITLGDAGYHVRDSGPGGDGVLLVHGMPDDGAMWQHQASALAEANHRVVCPDMLGYGRTDKPAEVERYRTASVVEDLAGLLDALGLDRVHFVGHDWGAVVGWEFAIAHPERLKSLVVMTVGHPASWFDESLDFERMRWNWYVLFNLSERAPEAYRADDGRLLREVLRSHPDKDRIARRLLEPGALEALLNWEKANALPEALLASVGGEFDGLPPVAAPTLGISGADDEFLWESQMKRSGEFVAGEWRFERIDSAGHWFMLEQPEETNRLLLDWFAKHR